MPEEKSDGKGILIIGGLIISGIIIALMLKAKPAQSTPSPLPGDLITIQQMQERVVYLEQQIKATSLLLAPLETMQSQVLEPRGGPGSEGFGFPLPIDRPQLQPFHSPTSQNLIQYQDGSVTDADVVQQGEKYKNKESWSIKRDADGAITGIDVERNASVGNNAT